MPTKRIVDWCPRAILEFQSFTPYGCFTALLFQGFITPHITHNSSHITHNFPHITHNSSPKLGEVPTGRRGLSPPEQTKIYLFAMGRSGGTSCPNDRAERYRSMQSRYRTRQTKTMSVCFYIGVPRANQDFICLLWGEAEVRVAQTIEQSDIGQCNLVTERDVIGLYDLIVERSVTYREILHNT